MHEIEAMEVIQAVQDATDIGVKQNGVIYALQLLFTLNFEKLGLGKVLQQ